ncbi:MULTISPECIES: hypothetical protein [Bradyrhizobium]|uniref:hypothetical protein n=1 Tax=Bradyrhizobium TaxID=374 RepID=UPI00005DD444|nr:MULTISPECIES: hypothetical protein [Bradyrhizobium]MCL8484009.1 hypothetical protein [Bradyrhizobium denitrificans]
MGNHIFVANEHNAFDYDGLTTEDALLVLMFRRARRLFPGWQASLADLPTEILISESGSRQVDGVWLRDPRQFLHDAPPRARRFLDRHGDLRHRLRMRSPA